MFLVTYFLSLPEFVNFDLGQRKRKQCAKKQTGKRQKQETESKKLLL